MVIYHAPADAFDGMADMTEEQKKEGMQLWFDWKDKIGDAVLDFGAPLMGGRRISPDGSTTDSNKEVAGYSIIQAENIESAQNLLKDHPHLAWTSACQIEVHEMAPM